MRVRWKRLFFWSSLGSVAVAVAVSVARKARKPAAAPEFYSIPPDCSGLTIRTQLFEAGEGRAKNAVWDEYSAQPTSFKVWNVLELQPQPSGTNPHGRTIYHISHVRQRRDLPQTGELVERFYGTLRSVDPRSRAPRNDELARGTILEIARCYVGGASNGVETGEVHRSGAPVADFVFRRPGDDAGS